VRRAAAAVVLLAVAARAGAEEPPPEPVGAELDACIAVDVAAVRRVMAIELGAPLAAAPQPGVTVVRATCEGAWVLLTVENPRTHELTSRRLELTAGGAPASARVRLLALAAVELVAAMRAERRRELEVLPAGTPAVVPRAYRHPPRRPPPRFGVAALACLRFGAGMNTAGAGVAASARGGGVLLYAAEVIYERGSETFESGTVSGGLLSISPRVGLLLRAGSTQLELLAGARAGLAFLGATPADDADGVVGGELTAAWGGPVAVLAARSAGERLAARVALEGWWNVVTVDARLVDEQQRLVGGTGLMLSFALLAGI
jgi:hypothetical protein